MSGRLRVDDHHPLGLRSQAVKIAHTVFDRQVGIFAGGRGWNNDHLRLADQPGKQSAVHRLAVTPEFVPAYKSDQAGHIK